MQDLEYYSHTVDFNRERLRESTEESQIVFTSDFQGNVYYLPYSYTEFAVHVLDFQGNPIYTIEEDRIPRERPAEEIEEEREEVRQQLLAEGAPPEMRWDPSEYRPMVPFIGMGVDPEGRLWVRDGREEYPCSMCMPAVSICLPLPWRIRPRTPMNSGSRSPRGEYWHGIRILKTFPGSTFSP